MLRIIGATPREAVFTAHHYSPEDFSVYTFSGVDIGTPTPDRVVVVGAVTASINAITSVTLDGSNMARQIPLADSYYACLFSQNVASGTTADIVMHCDSTGVHICVWALYRVSSRTALEAKYTHPNKTPHHRTFNVPAGSIALAVAIGRNGTSAPMAWTGVDEDSSKQTIEPGACGHKNRLLADPSYIIDAEPTGGKSFMAAGIWK